MDEGVSRHVDTSVRERRAKLRPIPDQPFCTLLELLPQQPTVIEELISISGSLHTSRIPTSTPRLLHTSRISTSILITPSLSVIDELISISDHLYHLQTLEGSIATMHGPDPEEVKRTLFANLGRSRQDELPFSNVAKRPQKLWNEPYPASSKREH
ncbi:uncharacterized protein TRIVIDRAFT_227862 [Trichoderma virens Gv29-8]|uniref:Uncharacterized protein n=1 Tax=Hypocrea virens (strain Gv29-8 / FGSC 10586) TaxID=413071 RepID=G9NAR5_HYPVG|nr:uncharacterized protein TRIVIDRAFT_227862 [Trichoderma virens Gv29-8]EHK15926.1 hypothetical protein TRIVIDRAFT_227862 [Trichoderma virens Gv29-8]UKZ56302.1 hypothetical protein TrVGV298_010137 [Trichoderma virens]